MIELPSILAERDLITNLIVMAVIGAIWLIGTIVSAMEAAKKKKQRQEQGDGAPVDFGEGPVIIVNPETDRVEAPPIGRSSQPRPGPWDSSDLPKTGEHPDLPGRRVPERARQPETPGSTQIDRRIEERREQERRKVEERQRAEQRKVQQRAAAEAKRVRDQQARREQEQRQARQQQRDQEQRRSGRQAAAAPSAPAPAATPDREFPTAPTIRPPRDVVAMGESGQRRAETSTDTARNIRLLLQQGGGIKEAVILAEILGRPGGMQRDR